MALRHGLGKENDILIIITGANAGKCALAPELKTEMANGWIVEPEKGRVIEKEAPSDTMEAV